MRKIGAWVPFFTILPLVLIFSIQPAGFALDTTKYIPIDEIRTDMDAYCLTVFSGTQVEKFGLKILSVVRNQRPGQDMILVIGTDERFLNSSAVHGCSGSPVYIDGRMAGALAAGWDGSLEPLYLVRPIQDMHNVGTADSESLAGSAVALAFDYSQPLDLASYHEQSIKCLQERNHNSGMYLPLTSSLPASVIEPFDAVFRGAGLMPVAAGPLLPSSSFSKTGDLVPGGVLALVLCGGDISLSATGTVTDVIGDQIYGFGHHFNGQGAVNYPIASGLVHTIVASRVSSFKFTSPGPVLGTLDFDQSSAVRGTKGKMPKTLGLSIEVDRYNDPEKRVYDCYLAVDRELTPLILRVAINGAVQMQGEFPSEHTVRYSGKIIFDDNESIEFDNISSQRSLSEASMEVGSAVGMLLNNPFEKVKVNSVDVKVDVKPDNMTASVWAVNVSQTKVRPGQTVKASVVLRSFRSQEETVTIDLKIPETLKPGQYKIQIMGASDYQSFASGLAPHKFRATDLTSLKKGLNRVLQYRRDRLYAVMQTPASGLVIRQHEMAQLPPTKMLLMQDSKRLLPLEPYKAWAENSIVLEKIIQGQAEIEIIVER